MPRCPPICTANDVTGSGLRAASTGTTQRGRRCGTIRRTRQGHRTDPGPRTSIGDGEVSHKQTDSQTRSNELTTEFVRHDRAQNSTGTSEPDRVRVIREGVASYLPDIDPEETAEWLEAFAGLRGGSGPAGGPFLMLPWCERRG